MRKLILLAIVGLIAQLVDGSLGMAYGATSATLLLATGVGAAATSATVHLAEIGTTLASGASHWRFGNVDWKVVGKIAIPGAIGAFAGATFLSNLSTETAAPVMSGILLAIGIYLLIRFTGWGMPKGNLGKPVRKRFLAPLGIFAGFVDASGGGGWGPVATPALLASGRMEPRKVIGSVDTSEFVVSVAASVGFIIGIGSAGISFGAVAALLIGGLIAAPIAAYLVRLIPSRILGSLVGGLIVLTNVRTILRSDLVDASDGVQYTWYVGILLVWIAAVVWSVRAYRREKAEDAADEQASVPA
ncbi:sulfite exporter TauE/SafE family protein [Tenggerimyces flavus]|uniref:Probable membrane transporter protein n=1 Tax=Tenggerimyces flavus TaxID=1708749 RepID=A0ABV7YIL8_9ACTN|nr:sulfite exporter TauE/SafE family protein [Tenggerimyces flavus]MBM7783983.1 putative membrane protein YfcA [Tenggerimyces flavus]